MALITCEYQAPSLCSVCGGEEGEEEGGRDGCVGG